MGVKIVDDRIVVSRPLALDGAHNVRDLGEYKNQEREELKTHQFLRADSLHNLSPSDQEKLEAYGVKAVIDLRSRQEREKAPCVWEHSGQVAYYSVPMLDEMNSSGFQGMLPERMSKLYMELLENSQKEFAQIFKIMCRYERECVVFHCTAGKDRTGVTAMLLLNLAGVESQVIAADYAASEHYMRETFRQQKEQMKSYGIEIPEYMLESKPREMERTLEFLVSEYGSAGGYLEKIGLTREEIGKLKGKLCWVKKNK